MYTLFSVLYNSSFFHGCTLETPELCQIFRILETGFRDSCHSFGRYVCSIIILLKMSWNHRKGVLRMVGIQHFNFSFISTAISLKIKKKKNYFLVNFHHSCPTEGRDTLLRVSRDVCRFLSTFS